jgi:hypothetical protein
MELVQRWFWIILVVVVILLVVHPRSAAPRVIGALSHETTDNIKTLQGNAGSV